ncbi:MAG: hypothetical protein F4Y92_05535 [Dehalococcoidia bacterium]|nr:hypothetical protein [Dehalococcoidia bacterium]
MFYIKVVFGKEFALVTLDTQKAVTQLEDAGAPGPLARATVEVVEEGVEKGTQKLVTEAILYRALLIQGGVLVGAFAAIDALVG